MTNPGNINLSFMSISYYLYEQQQNKIYVKKHSVFQAYSITM